MNITDIAVLVLANMVIFLIISSIRTRKILCEYKQKCDTSVNDTVKLIGDDVYDRLLTEYHDIISLNTKVNSKISENIAIALIKEIRDSRIGDILQAEYKDRVDSYIDTMVERKSDQVIDNTLDTRFKSYIKDGDVLDHIVNSINAKQLQVN